MRGVNIKAFIDKRIKRYGDPVPQFQKLDQIVQLFDENSSRELRDGEEHCLRQIVMKISRLLQEPTEHDHYLDIQGYTDIWRRINNVEIPDDCS